MRFVHIHHPSGQALLCHCGKAHRWDIAGGNGSFSFTAHCPDDGKIFHGAVYIPELDSARDPLQMARQAAPAASGATCVGCKEFYPYAVAVTGFRCWGCRC